jgi:hypothetical protein
MQHPIVQRKCIWGLARLRQAGYWPASPQPNGAFPTEKQRFGATHERA